MGSKALAASFLNAADVVGKKSLVVDTPLSRGFSTARPEMSFVSEKSDFLKIRSRRGISSTPLSFMVSADDLDAYEGPKDPAIEDKPDPVPEAVFPEADAAPPRVLAEHSADWGRQAAYSAAKASEEAEYAAQMAKEAVALGKRALTHVGYLMNHPC